MTRTDKKEINKAIKELKKFQKICQKTIARNGFYNNAGQRIALILLEQQIEKQIICLTNKRKYDIV